MKNEFLMLAHKWEPAKRKISGRYVSEKLDGLRFFWDGGISRGIAKIKIPYANNTEKDARFKIAPVATGLWSRRGHPIMAPKSFLDALPKNIPLDGELYRGRGMENRQALFSSVRSLDASEDAWDGIRSHVFSIPPMGLYTKDVDWWSKPKPHSTIQDFLKTATFFNERVVYVEQTQLPFNWVDAQAKALSVCNEIYESGGEGIMLLDPMGFWERCRSYSILKYKPFDDGEAEVIGFTCGRETDKGSRLLGKIGALILRWNNVRFECAGLTDKDREFATFEMYHAATSLPGLDAPSGFQGKQIKIGTIVNFKYRGLSKDGVPVEARYNGPASPDQEN